MQNSYKMHWPVPLPQKATTQHPKCNDVLFLHYKVQKKLLRKLVPKELELDNFDGDYWISILGFEKVNSFSKLCDLYIRTYVKFNERAGVYNLKMERNGSLPWLLTKIKPKVFFKSENITKNRYLFETKNLKENSLIHIKYGIGKQIRVRSKLDLWLTEHSALYRGYKKGVKKFNILQNPRNLRRLKPKYILVDYPKYLKVFSRPPDVMHYAERLVTYSINNN